MAKKRDMSWLKPGVKVWVAEGTDVVAGTFGRIAYSNYTHLFYLAEDKPTRSPHWAKNAYPTEAEACRAAADACEKRRISLEKQSAAMWGKRQEFLRRAEEARNA